MELTGTHGKRDNVTKSKGETQTIDTQQVMKGEETDGKQSGNKSGITRQGKLNLTQDYHNKTGTSIHTETQTMTCQTNTGIED